MFKAHLPAGAVGDGGARVASASGGRQQVEVTEAGACGKVKVSKQMRPYTIAGLARATSKKNPEITGILLCLTQNVEESQNCATYVTHHGASEMTPTFNVIPFP